MRVLIFVLPFLKKKINECEIIIHTLKSCNVTLKC